MGCREMPNIRWNVYIQDREMAQVLGDPILGWLHARDWKTAMRYAHMSFYHPGGTWAYPALPGNVLPEAWTQ